jgi:hypothetical protein
MSFMSKVAGGGLSRLGTAAVDKPPPIRAFSEMGVSGTAVHGGYVYAREKSGKWTGDQKYVTSTEIVVNTSIVAAGVHHFLNLVARPRWTVSPPDDGGDEAKELAEFVETVLDDMASPWSRVVRRAGMYRFHGFGLHEWTAKRREDGRVGFADVEPRPQHTIKQWMLSDNGVVTGVVQESPQTGQRVALPRGKLMYLVDDTLSDSPEGIGILRHLAEPYERLKTYYVLEAVAFERDLRGVPIGRVPYTIINQAVKDQAITEEEAAALTRAMEDFVKIQVKQPNTSITLDSMPYESEAADGRKIASVMQWGIELLQGSSNGVEHLGAAITRTQHEMARILAAEHLMMGESSGNRALSEDKSRNLYLVANAVLMDIKEAAEKDVIGPLWLLNGFPDELKPSFEPEGVEFKDAEAVARVLKDMATAGATLSPVDPVIDDVRELMGVSASDPVPVEMAGLPTASPSDEEIEDDLELGDSDDDGDDVEKGEQPRVPAGSPAGGQFGSVGGGASGVMSKMGTIAPEQVEPLTRQLGQDPDLDILADRGQMMSKDGWSAQKGKKHACHPNSAKLYDKGKVDTIATGYARGSGGYWYQHSWGIKDGKIVETTVEFDEYFGVELTKAEATRFAQHQITNKPIGKKALPRGLKPSASITEWPPERSEPKVAWRAAKKTNQPPVDEEIEDDPEEEAEGTEKGRRGVPRVRLRRSD